MTRFRIEDLRELTARLVERAGASRRDAEIFAHALLDADLHGASTHGISRLNIYLERMARGLIDPKAALKVDHQTGSVLVLDACNGLGQVQACKALQMLFPLASSNGVAVATLRNSQHFGALSYYCNQAAEQGMILLAMTNCEPAMSPVGGYEPFFGTNPIAASFPTGSGFPVKVDLATSVVARGNIIAANKQKKPIPPDWALDKHGQPTTDAAEALLGTVKTMAGHKGYALALMVEVFSSVLSGSAIGSEIGSMYKDLDRPQNVGHFFCLFDIAAFTKPEEFRRRMDQTILKLKDGKRQPEVDEILVPGECSARKAAVNSKEGISVDPETIAELEKWCASLDVPFYVAEVFNHA